MSAADWLVTPTAIRAFFLAQQQEIKQLRGQRMALASQLASLLQRIGRRMVREMRRASRRGDGSELNGGSSDREDVSQRSAGRLARFAPVRQMLLPNRNGAPPLVAMKRSVVTNSTSKQSDTVLAPGA